MKRVLLLIIFIYSLIAVHAQTPARIENGKLLLSHSIEFKPGTAELVPASDIALNEIKEFLTAKKYISTLRIESHVAKGYVSGNADEFTKARSMAIAKWLVKSGVDCKRLLPVAFGNNKTIVADDGEANTRIELIPAALNNHPIGGIPLDGGGLVAGKVCGE